MVVLTLGNWLSVLLSVMFVLIAVLLVLVVLIQKPKGGGLSGAFGGGGGGGGGGEQMFGAKTGDALTVITVGVFVFFLALAISLVYVVRAENRTPDVPGIQQAAPDADATGDVPAIAEPAEEDAPAPTEGEADAPASTPDAEDEDDRTPTPGDAGAGTETVP